MGKCIFVTEKPSVAREYAKILGVTEKNDGYYENEKYIITWCVGHLVTLAYPEYYDPALKKWELETLPFLPQEYKYVVIDDVKKQFNVIKKLYNRSDIDKIYYAGDAGREGAYIQALVRQMAGRNPNAEERMVWIDSQTKDEILRGIKEAKPWSDYSNMVSSGYMRAIEDFSTGINFSRLETLLYGEMVNQAAATEKSVPISVGRVMTCVLGMIVEREREILSFVPTKFYKIKSTISYNGIPVVGEWKVTDKSNYFESPRLYNENGFKEKNDAEDLMRSLSNKILIKEVEKTFEKKNAPLLFNLAELQSECSKKFKISPDATLAVAQSLYEKKMLTYPRTDARVLSTAVAKEITDNLNGLKDYEPTTSFCEEILQNDWDKGLVKSRYTDDSKVTDHYAIIPTGEGFENLGDLSELERNIYELVVRRFLSVFYPPAEYFKIKVTESVDNEEFYASGRILNKPGYLKVAGKSEEDSSPNISTMALSSLKEGAVYNGEYHIDEGSTTPPKRYTSGNMVLAMENAGQLIEDEELRSMIKGSGIGTSATRAETIKKLVKLNYIHLNTKTQILTPSDLGNIIYEVIHMTIPALLNPRMTASWEKGLDGIVKGEISANKYRGTLEDYVRKEAENLKNNDLSEALREKILPYAKNKNFTNTKQEKSYELSVSCPLCNGKLTQTKFGCICENYEKTDNNIGNGCRFAIGNIAGATLTKNELEELISTGKLNTRGGFVSKSKKKFEAGLKFSVITDENGNPITKIEFVFPEKEEPKNTDVNCPLCNSMMKKNTWNFECNCGYKLSHVIAKKNLDDNTIKELIKNKKTKLLSGFKSKAGKSFSAQLVMNEKGEISFEFQKK